MAGLCAAQLHLQSHVLADGILCDALQGIPDSLKDYNVLAVTLGEEPVSVLGLRFWNYNKSPADTTRGLKRCIVLAGQPPQLVPVVVNPSLGCVACNILRQGALVCLACDMGQGHGLHLPCCGCSLLRQ